MVSHGMVRLRTKWLRLLIIPTIRVILSEMQSRCDFPDKLESVNKPRYFNVSSIPGHVVFVR